MLFASPEVMCVGKPEPRAWEYNGRSGVSYKVQISDGYSSIELPVKDAEVWNQFVPMGKHLVTIELTQVANDNRLSTRSRVVDVKPIES